MRWDSDRVGMTARSLFGRSHALADDDGVLRLSAGLLSHRSNFTRRQDKLQYMCRHAVSPFVKCRCRVKSKFIIRCTRESPDAAVGEG